MAKKTQHGGKRTGAGRKPKPDDERRSEVFSIRVTADEKLLLDDTGASGWGRVVLLKAAKRRVK